ncbi:fluoride efflux transporter FluC [Streptomyces griseocarneus]|uniref:fluoride efflux transporter FluC n=1 Tax=Streptomyces griseocarneus TaxID=51201 RepID=UPI00167E2627|nr:CrcB family protein [Streptomyces griseocarneus]MBZ6475554.1 CrcB family protein [Streptomyces griseocarneus]GHG69629.1 putative fluoride ion transporter CrcB 1 [Streptomyces griseocarneus]
MGTTRPGAVARAGAAPAPARRRGTPGQWPVLCAVSLGGAAGAAARYGAGLLWPTANGTFPWTTLLVNAVGCALIGVLLVTIAEAGTPHRLARPFLGTGVLGGFTTFSTYAVDIEELVRDGHAGTAAAYAAATLCAAMAAVWTAATATRRLITRRTR